MTKTSTYTASLLGQLSSDPLSAARARQAATNLWALPEALTDPFNGLKGRIQATLDTYRFNAPPPNSQRPRSPGTLLDWAIGQTQQDDPLVHHSRQELEQAFARFSRDRDVHLAQLVESAKKQGKADVVAELFAETTDPAAKKGLSDAMRRVGL